VRRREPAQALIWFTLALPLFVSMAGLAVDGAMLLATRRQLQSVADGAARAGATRVDLDRLRGSGGADVQLDPASAYAAAHAYLDERLPRELGWDVAPELEIDVAPRRVRVLVQGVLHTAFLRIVHLDSVPVAASASADVRFGIRDDTGS
jgi:hypothetical protein